MNARPYQAEAVAAVERLWTEGCEDGRSPLLVMSTGSGKTETALMVVASVLRRGGRVAFLAHREELVAQPAARFTRGFPDMAKLAGIVQADRDQPAARFLCASIPTLLVESRRAAVLRHGPFDLLVVDEAHHSTSPSHRNVIAALRGPNTLMLGLTATPDREDGGDLSEHWEIAYTYDIVRATREGWLVPPYAVVDRLPRLDLSKVSGRRDYDDAELGKALLLAGVVEHTVVALEKTHLCTRLPRLEGGRVDTKYKSAKGSAVLVFTATVEQARLTADALNAAGWRARPISGETPKDDRRRLLKAFEAGTIDVLVNAAVLTEGTDLPRASTVVFARPTKSWSFYVQMVGRGLRLYDPAWSPSWGMCNALDPRYAGKPECLVVDLAGCTDEHSLVAAPVLIGGSRCPKSPNGAHEFAAYGPEKGRCVHCERKIPCFPSIEAGGTGAHVWTDDDEEHRRCKFCVRPQCEMADDGKHMFLPQAEAKQVCIHCGLEIPDPLASMVGERRAAGPPEKAAWLKLADLTPETWVVDVDEHGFLFMVGSREADAWVPTWAPARARRARPLTDGPVSGGYARALADDLVRKAQRARDQSKRNAGEMYGAKSSEREYLATRSAAAQTAIRLGIANRGGA